MYRRCGSDWRAEKGCCTTEDGYIQGIKGVDPNLGLRERWVSEQEE